MVSLQLFRGRIAKIILRNDPGEFDDVIDIILRVKVQSEDRRILEEIFRKRKYWEPNPWEMLWKTDFILQVAEEQDEQIRRG